jgi:RNA polymerase sigma-70 factor (ECF subfamily)
VRELYPNQDDDGSRTRSLVLRDALAALPEEQREVIVLRHVLGLSPGEIAGRLGRTEPSVHGLHHRGRGALRTALSEMQCGPTVGGKAAA